MKTLIAVIAALALTASTGLGQDPAPKIKKVNASYTSPSSGKEMFTAYCAPCHGMDAKGGGPAAAALKKAPADLTMLSKKHDGKFPMLEVQQFIRGDMNATAHGSREMPVWGDIFHSFGGNQDQIVTLRVKNLSDFIQGMQAK